MNARLSTLSRADACAHLLRHLNDATAVRSNPLVEHFFGEQQDGARLLSADREALSEVRALVRAAAEALGMRDQNNSAAVHARRQHEILMRCDLNRERHEGVAHDLGLSLSQFYRERRAARMWVADYIAKHGRPAKVSSLGARVLDTFAFEIAYAHTLRSAGDHDRAIALLQDLTHELEFASQRLEVYCLLVKFLYDARRFGEIHLALQAARECFANLRLAGAGDIEQHLGRLEMATSDYYWASGDSASALTSKERAIAAFQSVRYKFRGSGEETLANALLDLVHQYLSVGRFREANDAIVYSRAVIEDLAVPSAQLQAAFLVGLGFVQTNAVDTMSDAIPTLHAARDIAHTHRLGKEAIWATAGLSMHAQFRGDLPTAIEYIEECVSLGKHLLTPFDHSNILLRLLELKSVSAPLEAIVLASNLREHFAPESAGWIKAMLFSAMASFSAGDFMTALQMSQLASEIAARRNDFRLHGAALRIQAAAGAKLGHADAARNSIERAIEVLEAHGSPYILLLTYEDSSRITGNHHHAANALEMRSTVFRSSQLSRQRSPAPF